MTRLMTLICAAVLTLLPGLAAAELGDDGLHREDWIRETFKDLREDLAEADAEGKRLLVMVEQRGCIYCTQMHEEVYSRPDVRDYLEENFFVVRVNLHGDTEVTDFDGEVLTEKQAVRRWGVLFTPTLMFIDEEVAEDSTAQQAAVAVMPGAFGPGTTIDMMTWVAEKRYTTEDEEDFQRYHARRVMERDDGRTD